jgi:hypothetical protein
VVDEHAASTAAMVSVRKVRPTDRVREVISVPPDLDSVVRIHRSCDSAGGGSPQRYPPGNTSSFQ